MWAAIRTVLNNKQCTSNASLLVAVLVLNCNSKGVVPRLPAFAEWLISVFDSGAVGPGSNRSRDAVGNSLRQTVHTHRASVHQAAKLVAALLRVAGITAGLVENNGSLPPGS